MVLNSSRVSSTNCWVITVAITQTEGSIRPEGHPPLVDYANTDDNDLVYSRFLGSRQTFAKRSSLGAALMPVIELVNHHSRANGFVTDKDSYGITCSRTPPGESPDEMFVNYGRFKDAFTLYRNYHFTHLVPDHVESVPLILTPQIGHHLFINRIYARQRRRDDDMIKRLPPGIETSEAGVTCSRMWLSLDDSVNNMRIGIGFMLKLLGKKPVSL